MSDKEFVPMKMEFFAISLMRLMDISNVATKDVVEATGISQSWFSDLFNGKKKDVSFGKVCKLADYFNVKLDYFVFSNNKYEGSAEDLKEMRNENIRLRQQLEAIRKIII